MRELDITAKQNLKDDLIVVYDDIFNMIIPRFTKYLSPVIVSDEYTAGAEVSNNVTILK